MRIGLAAGSSLPSTINWVLDWTVDAMFCKRQRLSFNNRVPSVGCRARARKCSAGSGQFVKQLLECGIEALGRVVLARFDLGTDVIDEVLADGWQRGEFAKEAGTLGDIHPVGGAGDFVVALLALSLTSAGSRVGPGDLDGDGRVVR